MTCVCESEFRPIAVVNSKEQDAVVIHYICEDEKGNIVLQICREDYHHQVNISPTGQSVRVFSRKEGV